jgi:hypothetical protein
MWAIRLVLLAVNPCYKSFVQPIRRRPTAFARLVQVDGCVATLLSENERRSLCHLPIIPFNDDGEDQLTHETLINGARVQNIASSLLLACVPTFQVGNFRDHFAPRIRRNVARLDMGGIAIESDDVGLQAGCH